MIWDDEFIKTQFELPLDHEPCLNYLAILMANEDVESGVCSNWDAAYESAWDYLEEKEYDIQNSAE